MAITKEEQSILLYALYVCGGKGSTGRIVDYVLTNGLMKEREDDYNLRTGGEEVVRNNLRWASDRLKKAGELDKPQRGIWVITDKGREHLERIAKNVHKKSKDQLDELSIDLARYNRLFLDRLSQLGAKLMESSAASE